MPISLQNEQQISAQIKFYGEHLEKHSKNKNLKFDNTKLPLIIKKYKYIRNNLRNYMTKGEDTVIDRHKIAAIFAVSILAIEPIKINKSSVWSDQNANIIMGFYCAKAIMKDFYKKATNDAITFDDPPTYNNHKYIIEYVKLVDVNKKLLLEAANSLEEVTSIFFLSHLFFMFEHYTIKAS